MDETFSGLGLDERILKALNDTGYELPSEIQSQSIPPGLEGKDIFASAQTGTGKTAAFGLPILQLLSDEGSSDEKGRSRERSSWLRALILSPTRELALQIKTNLDAYSAHLPVKVLTVYGGTPINPQITALQKRVDVVVATPGRLLDLLERKAIKLNHVKHFVLDEADRMLDMGFVQDVRDIARRLPKERQTMLFSATLSEEVRSLAGNLLKDPIEVSVAAQNEIADNILQQVYFVEAKDKAELLFHIIKTQGIERALVFTATKGNANVLANQLSKRGVKAEAVHSDRSQKQCQKSLDSFDDEKLQVLIATDVLARGIDVDSLTHVINFELPNDPENYVHRIGRTARAGASGTAISFCGMHEASLLQNIERFTKIAFTVVENHPYHSPLAFTMKKQSEGISMGRRGRFGGGTRRR